MRHPTYANVLALTLIAAVFTACLGSTGLASWADGLPDSALARAAAAGTHRLDWAMTSLHINALPARLHAAVQAMEAGKFVQTQEP